MNQALDVQLLSDEDNRQRMADIGRGRDQNIADPIVANRTKVVRLIVVPDAVVKGGADAVRDFALARHATRADVFIVPGDNGRWVPMSWLGGGLVDHHQAPLAHPEAVLVLMVVDREQVQWESDVPFRIAGIRKAQNDHFPSSNHSPDPNGLFRGTLFSEVGFRGRPIVSGPPSMNGNVPYNQLYKVSFQMILPGSPDWQDVDPDIYCDWS